MYVFSFFTGARTQTSQRPRLSKQTLNIRQKCPNTQLDRAKEVLSINKYDYTRCDKYLFVKNSRSI